jgi:hypothetical protein
MSTDQQPRQFLDLPSSLKAEKDNSLICTLKIDTIQYIENYLCIAGWSTKPLNIHSKDKNKWLEFNTEYVSRPDVEANIKVKPGSKLGFIAVLKIGNKKEELELKFENIEDPTRFSIIDNACLLASLSWKKIIQDQLKKNKHIKQKTNYKSINKTMSHHPEGHGHLEIARKSRGFDDLVVIGWLSAKNDELFFIETDDDSIIAITDTFRFFRQDIENIGISASHGKIKEKTGFIAYIQSAKHIKKIHLCGLHEEVTHVIHEISPETVNESAENSIDWSKNIAHSSPDEYVNRLKKFESPYRNRRLEQISTLAKKQRKEIDLDVEITVIIISGDHWRTKAIITTLEVNNNLTSKYIALFQCQEEEQRFKALKPTLSAAFDINPETLSTSPLYETAFLNNLIIQAKSKSVLIINDEIIPNQVDFLQQAIHQLNSEKALALIPLQLDIYGEEHCSYIEINKKNDQVNIYFKKTFFGRSPKIKNKPHNLDCVIFDKEKLKIIGGIDHQIDIRSLFPRAFSIDQQSEFNTIFTQDVYVTTLRQSRTIMSSPPTETDIKNLVNLNLI